MQTVRGFLLICTWHLLPHRSPKVEDVGTSTWSRWSSLHHRRSEVTDFVGIGNGTAEQSSSTAIRESNKVCPLNWCDTETKSHVLLSTVFVLGSHSCYSRMPVTLVRLCRYSIESHVRAVRPIETQCCCGQKVH